MDVTKAQIIELIKLRGEALPRCIFNDLTKNRQHPRLEEFITKCLEAFTEDLCAYLKAKKWHQWGDLGGNFEPGLAYVKHRVHPKELYPRDDIRFLNRFSGRLIEAMFYKYSQNLLVDVKKDARFNAMAYDLTHLRPEDTAEINLAKIDRLDFELRRLKKKLTFGDLRSELSQIEESESNFKGIIYLIQALSERERPAAIAYCQQFMQDWKETSRYLDKTCKGEEKELICYAQTSTLAMEEAFYKGNLSSNLVGINLTRFYYTKPDSILKHYPKLKQIHYSISNGNVGGRKPIIDALNEGIEQGVRVTFRSPALGIKMRDMGLNITEEEAKTSVVHWKKVLT